MNQPRPINHNPLPSGSWIGMLGGGQLGLFFVEAAQKQGYKVHVYTPEPDSPTSRLADCTTVAGFDDNLALKTFAQSVAIITLEFENIPLAAIDCLNALTPVVPNHTVLATAQNRLKEKTLVESLGFAVTPFCSVDNVTEAQTAFETLGPGILKTNTLGYDGKGQYRISTSADISPLTDIITGQSWIYEQWVPFQTECSLIGCRSLDGSVTTLGLFENYHQNGILHRSTTPTAALNSLTTQAITIVQTVMTHLDAYGLLCIEFFVTTDNQLVFNEMAPRPHNSGHLTMEATTFSQFDLHVKAVTGQTLAPSTNFTTAACMVNLLGDLWLNGEPDWSVLADAPNETLHLYGKAAAKPGRKMGHITVVGSSAQASVIQAEALFNRLQSTLITQQ